MLLAEAQGLPTMCPGADKRNGDDEQHGKVFTPSMSVNAGSGGGVGTSREVDSRQEAKDFVEAKVSWVVKTRLRPSRQRDNSFKKRGGVKKKTWQGVVCADTVGRSPPLSPLRG